MKDSSKSWQRFKKHIDSIFFIFGLLLLVALAVAVMVSECIACCLQHLLGLTESENGKYDVLETIGFCIAGVLLVWQAWTTNKRAKTTEANAKNTEAGQQEERLKNAIEHLGHKSSASVRMGGAYGLFHLAKDAKDKGLKSLPQTVLKILCAHIRQTTKGQTTTDQTTGEYNYQKEHEKEPSGEIQGLLTLLFVQKDDHHIFENCSINLQDSYLYGAKLSKARLQDANLRDAQLQRAQLQGADLKRAQLQRAVLSEVQMQGADLKRTQLQGAVLSEAQMQGADFGEAQLQGTHLYKAQLQEADLRQAQLQGVSSQKTDHFSSAGFESRIKDRIGKPSDLDGIIFADGLQEEDLKTLCEGLSDDQGQALRKKLESHVGQPASHELLKNSGAVTGTYTQKEAEQWIAKYNDAMSEAPRANDTANADSAADSGKGKGD